MHKNSRNLGEKLEAKFPATPLVMMPDLEACPEEGIAKTNKKNKKPKDIGNFLVQKLKISGNLKILITAHA